jgi:hypothetical protein
LNTDRGLNEFNRGRRRNFKSGVVGRPDWRRKGTNDHRARKTDVGLL